MSMNEPPPTLMSLPKEIRLRIMEMASEDILPEMELIFSGKASLALYFELTHMCTRRRPHITHTIFAGPWLVSCSRSR